MPIDSSTKPTGIDEAHHEAFTADPIVEGLERAQRGEADAHVWSLETFPKAPLDFHFSNPGEEQDRAKEDKLKARYPGQVRYNGVLTANEIEDYLSFYRNAGAKKDPSAPEVWETTEVVQ